MPLDFILNKINDLATREQLIEICKGLYEECKKLEIKIEEIENWKKRAEQYEEYQVSGGSVVLRNKMNKQYYCPVCFEKNKMIFPLQPYGNGLNCPNCKALYKTDGPTGRVLGTIG